MNTVFLTKVCKSESNLNSLLSLTKNLNTIQSIVVSESNNRIYFDSQNTESVICSNQKGYVKYFLSSVEYLLEKDKYHNSNTDTASNNNDVIAFIPDSFVFSDKIFNFVFDALNDSRVSVAFLGSHDNRLVSLNDVSIDNNYNLYKVFNTPPSTNDLENVFFIRKSVMIRVYKEILIQKSLFERLNSHYLCQFIYDFVLRHNEVSISIVNERMSLSKDYIEFFLDKKSKINDLKVAQSLDIVPTNKLSFLQNLFSITKFNRHTVVTLCGLSIPFKVKKQPKFPTDAIEYSSTDTFVEKDLVYKRACLFASFTANGKVKGNTLNYLKNLREFNDYIIYVADSKALPETINCLEEHTDCVIIKRHQEYDFGSYKRAFDFLNSKGIIDKLDSILICNDSVDFVGNREDLKKILDVASVSDAYAICKATYGFGNKIKRHKYEWTKNPHLQSYFLVLNKKVFRANYFKNFMLSITRLKNKTQIIKEYEMGLSELLKANNVKLGSYYPYDDTNIVNPYAIFLDPHVEHPIFVKHMLTK